MRAEQSFTQKQSMSRIISVSHATINYVRCPLGRRIVSFAYYISFLKWIHLVAHLFVISPPCYIFTYTSILAFLFFNFSVTLLRSVGFQFFFLIFINGFLVSIRQEKMFKTYGVFVWIMYVGFI